MIDAHSALRLHLLEASDLRTLLGGPYVYWPELPAGTSGAAKRVVFRFNGGSADDDLPLHRYTVNFRCYGETAYKAFEVYRELHDRLVRTGPFIVTDTFPNPDEHVAFYNVAEITPGQPLQDPGTGWHYTFSVWSATVATTGVVAPTFPS
jgi:hypothetical protein